LRLICDLKHCFRFELAIKDYQTVLTKSRASPITILDGAVSESTDQLIKTPGSCESPTKIAKPYLDEAATRFVYDCLLDCFRKTDDWDGLAMWLEKRQAFLNNVKNGTTTEKLFDLPLVMDSVKFHRNVQEILLNKSSKYQWKCKENIDEVRQDGNIKILDESILECKVSGYEETRVNETCKAALNQLSDWSQVQKPCSAWRVDNLTDSLRESLIRDALLVKIGRSLESKSFVLQTSEGKIEIDLHGKQLAEEWGASYDFELSNILKEIKEKYVKEKRIVHDRMWEVSGATEALLREKLRSGRPTSARDLLIMDYVGRDVLENNKTIQDLENFSTERKFPSDFWLHVAFWKRLLGGDDVKLQVLTAARKEGNTELAKRCLLWHFKGTPPRGRDFVDVCDELVENFDRNMTSVEGQLCVQVAKLLYRYEFF